MFVLVEHVSKTLLVALTRRVPDDGGFLGSGGYLMGVDD